MKKTLILCAALGLLGLAACNEIERLGDGQVGKLELSFHANGATKASTDATGNETTLDNVQFFVFASDGSLYRYGSIEKGKTSQTLDNVKVGSYNVAAVANAAPLQDIGSRSELEAKAVSLGLNDPAKAFVMYGVTAEPTEVSAEGSGARADVTLRRFVSRVRITTVENRIAAAYGALQIDDVFLINGCENWNYAGSGAPSGYVNYAGRKAGQNTSGSSSDFITSKADAGYPDLTFSHVGKAVANGATETLDLPFYSFPNQLSKAEDNFNGPTSGPVCTRLVVKASFGGKSYYYPVTIEKMARNSSYDVKFIIQGSGSDDPNKKVDAGGYEVIVRVDPWTDGGDIPGIF